MKTILPSAILATLLLLSGCGSSDTTSKDLLSTSNSVIVERGPILGAVVLDADGQQALQDLNSTASYTFQTPPTYPIMAYGGYIDVNRNGIIDAGEVANTIVLQAEEGEVLTLLTSILSVSDENSTAFFLDDLGLNAALAPGEDINVSALSDVMYEYLIQNNLASVDDVNMSNQEQLRDRIELKIREYSASDINASEYEKNLILKLESELKIARLSEYDAEKANEKIKGIQNAIDVISALPNMKPSVKEHVLAILERNAAKKDEKAEDKKDKDEEESNEDEVLETPETVSSDTNTTL